MMKTCLLVAWLLAICLYGPVLAQQQVPLTKALEEVKSVYGTRFSYEEHLLDNISVTSNLKFSKNDPVENVLKNLLYNKGFLFLYVQKNYYTIIKDSRKQNSGGTTGEAQHNDGTEGATAVMPDYVQTITGRVTDPDGKPLVGATILPDGYAITQGITSNSDGQYTLRLRVKTEALVFSYIGMVPKKVPIEGKALLNVQLDFDANQLNTVAVVSTGYQTVPKERATGSFATVTAKDLKEVPAVNLVEKMEGTTPGVRFDVRKNTISIRGINSLTSSTSSTPLIVVDGFPVLDQTLSERTISQATAGAILSRYNPEDIESISILKDAAATSIWGAKAANGVIVITTKKGQKNSSKINFSSNLSITNPVDMKKLDRMSSAQYIDLEQEMFNLNYYSDPYSTSYAWNAPVSPALEWMFKVKRGTATAAQRDSALSVLSSQDNSSQIRNLMLQRGVSQQYALSLSGGGQNNTYYLSTNYSKDIPVFKSNKAESYFLTANLTNNLFNNKATLSTGINYNYSNSNTNQTAVNALGAGIYGLRPYDMLQDANGNSIGRNISVQDYTANALVAKGYQSFAYNPLQELNYGNTVDKVSRFRFNADLNTKINNWLSADVAGSIQRITGQTNALTDQDSYAARMLYNTYTIVNSDGSLTNQLPLGGDLITTNSISTGYSLRGQLNVNKNWKDFNLNAIAGSEIRETHDTKSLQYRYGYNADTKYSSAYNPTVNYMTMYGWTQQIGYNDGPVTDDIKRFLSYYGNAAVGYKNNRYVLSGSARFDDYTLLGVSRSKRAKPLWSTGFKWNVLDENFMKNVHFLNMLNMRVTYGTGGSVPTSATTGAVISFSGTNPITGQPYGTITSPANNTLGWELTKSWNMGLDLGFFKNRLSFTGDIYGKKTSDILYTFPIDATYGFSTIQFNAASMKGHGYEFGVTGQIIAKRDFNWTSSFNLSYNTNEVTDSRFVTPVYASSLVGGGTPVKGLPLDYIYAFRFAGLDSLGRTQIFNADGKKVNADASFSSILPKDLVRKGRSTPPYFGGFFNTFSYKGLTLGVRMTYEMGYMVRLQNVANYPTYQGFYGNVGMQKELANRWRKPGDEAITTIPGLPNLNYNSSYWYQYSDQLLVSGSNIRLQQLSLGYQLPQHLLSRTPVKSASFTASARNLGIIWRKNKAGVDPDYLVTNNYSNLSPSTAWYFSFNVGF